MPTPAKRGSHPCRSLGAGGETQHGDVVDPLEPTHHFKPFSSTQIGVSNSRSNGAQDCTYKLGAELWRRTHMSILIGPSLPATPAAHAVKDA
jgi:hypothetical protein